MYRIVTAASIAVALSASAQGSASDPETMPSTTQQGTGSMQKSRPSTTGTAEDKYGPMGTKPSEPSGQMVPTDLTKVGAASRKPTDEREAKREIEQVYKAEEQAMKDKDFDAKISHMDFPIFMATDDQRGMTEGRMFTKEEYTSMMKPHFDSMKDAKKVHHPSITILSDNMATVVDDFTVTSGKQKVTGKNTALLVKINGQWKFKSLIEAGWGEQHPEMKPGA